MRRALQLAGNGEGRVSPNPMVGAVIVHDGKIIGEGYHACFGAPHAEVNAINSVRPEDRGYLKDSTIYVTLEPCAHHGKTPPCADLIVKTGIPRVVIGSPDPNPLVSGKGVKILEDAGVKVTQNILRDECDYLNRRFLSAQKNDIPYITLKWAQSADGFIAGFTETGSPCPVKFSTPVSSVWVHRERAANDAIMIGANTERIDNPQLNVRYWAGKDPLKIVAQEGRPMADILKQLRKDGITSLLVEGGAKLLNWFITNGLYDEIRIEVAPFSLKKGVPSPLLPQNLTLQEHFSCGANQISVYRR